QDISAKANSGQGSEKLVVENVRLAEATRIAGYVALNFDESWKVATQDTTGLESRDSRTTPVTGKMAWFTLRDYKLALEIARNEPVLDATVVAHALPRAKQVEIEGQFTLDVTRAPLRKFDVQLPISIAGLLHVDSPLVGEQSLDAATGLWHFTLRKELLGSANIRFHLSLPVEASPDSSDSGLGTLSSVLPQFAFPTARHFNGQWVIEANTDTELTYATKGVQSVDALRAAAVEGYQPRHRVLAAFSYTAAAHEIKITATRHEPSALISAVVEQMNLISVLSNDGSSRHQAALLVKHNGQQFFSVRLPKGAQLLAAMSDNEAVKPVRAGEDEVRIPLNGGSSESGSVPVKIIYELTAEKWGSSGSYRLEPPAVSDGVPVLSANWRVYSPEGMEIRTTGGFGEQGENVRPVTLLAVLTKTAATASRDVLLSSNRRRMLHETTTRAVHVDDDMDDVTPQYPKPMFVGTQVPIALPDSSARSVNDSTSYLQSKLQRIIIPSVQFQGASLEEAIEFLRIKVKDLDVAENDATRRGINLILKTGARPSDAAISLDLHDVPVMEALRYITELAGMKYVIEPYAIVVMPVSDLSTEILTRRFKVPPDFLNADSTGQPTLESHGYVPDARRSPNVMEILRSSGISFPDGLSTVYIPTTSEIVVKNTASNLDAMEAFLNDLWAKHKRAESLSKKSGLISLDLTLPTTGRILNFSGHQKPEALTLSYKTW
ncbi:MAG: hypothetical protein WCN98_15960, partial [Verrucomicrobiaceae bacterium]